MARYQMDKAQDILTGVAESHAPSGSGFVVGGRAGEVEGDHTLILVPDIDHAVYMRIAAFYLITGKEIVPVKFQGFKRVLCPGAVGIFRQNAPGAVFSDNAGSLPFVILWVFAVTQDKDQFPWILQGSGSDGDDDWRWGTSRLCLNSGLVFPYRIGEGVSASCSEKSVSAGVVAVNRGVYAEKTVVATPFPIFGLVINGTFFHLDLPDTQVSLEVCAVVHCVPETELYIGKKAKTVWGFVKCW